VPQDPPGAQGEQFRYELAGPGALDLDPGRPADVSANSWDLVLVSPGYLVGPVSGSTMTVVPPNPSFDACSEPLASTRDPEISGTDLATGVTFCAITTQGAIAAVEAGPWAGGFEPLLMSWRLWPDER
jgi:hypothetical protein